MLAQLTFAIVHTAPHRFSVGVLSSCIYFFFFQRNMGSQKFVSAPRVDVRSRCRPTRAIGVLGPPRSTSRDRPFFVLSRTAQQWRFGPSRGDRLLVASVHAAAFGSRLDLLTLSGDKRGRSEALILLCLTEHLFPDPEPQKYLLFPHPLRLYHFARLASQMCDTRLCCNPTTEALSLSQTATVHASLQTPTLLSGSQIGFGSLRGCGRCRS